MEDNESNWRDSVATAWEVLARWKDCVISTAFLAVLALASLEWAAERGLADWALPFLQAVLP